LSCHIVSLPIFSYKTTLKGYILNLCPQYYACLCVTLVHFHINSPFLLCSSNGKHC
jgi:hypothetical protein